MHIPVQVEKMTYHRNFSLFLQKYFHFLFLWGCPILIPIDAVELLSDNIVWGLSPWDCFNKIYLSPLCTYYIARKICRTNLGKCKVYCRYMSLCGEVSTYGNVNCWRKASKTISKTNWGRLYRGMVWFENFRKRWMFGLSIITASFRYDI